MLTFRWIGSKQVYARARHGTNTVRAAGSPQEPIAMTPGPSRTMMEALTCQWKQGGELLIDHRCTRPQIAAELVKPGSFS